MAIDWNDFLNETTSGDTASIAIDKWNSKRYGGSGGKNVSKYKNGKTGNSNEMYVYGESSLITDRTRVFKGGSWKDRAYWLVPGTIRFLDQDQSTDAIGFRCAIMRLIMFTVCKCCITVCILWVTVCTLCATICNCAVSLIQSRSHITSIK